MSDDNDFLLSLPDAGTGAREQLLAHRFNYREVRPSRLSADVSGNVKPCEYAVLKTV